MGGDTFRATLTLPSNPIVWTNQDDSSNIVRSQDLVVTWSGGVPGRDFVGVLGSSADPRIGVGAQFVCTERAGAERFTVPTWVLSALPRIGQSQGVALGFLSVGSVLEPARFQASGLDVGIFNWGTLQARNVNYQ